MGNEPFFFGIRHLSPAGAFYLRRFLDEKRPKMVLVEGPDDLADMLVHLQNPEAKPPVAVLAYTKEAPVRTILYPFAEYSPEYQAVLWCGENGAECRFIDLPTEAFLALPSVEEAAQGEEERFLVYRALDQRTGEDGHETFWERTLEQAGSAEGYHQGANLFGKSLRELTQGKDSDWEEILLREAWMRKQIRAALQDGIAPEQMVIVTGAYHVEGLKSWRQEPSQEEMERLCHLPRVSANHTLMPYSDYRLSSRSGYGAGNKAPAYYALLWKALLHQAPMETAYNYLSRIAGYQRSSGSPVSSASVIEAVRLSYELARLRGGHMPALRDLRDAAVTCLGGGDMASVSLAVADTEIGTKIGSLPEGVSRTSIQEDFYRQLKELKLDKYRDITAQDLALDLREKRNVVSEKSAFLDLHRSFFLHRLRVLGVSFVNEKKRQQENATWGEQWVLRWTPEAEIELVEAALKGDTIVQAAAFHMKAPLLPILEKIFYRACLLLSGACHCDDNASGAVAAAMQQLNAAALSHDFLNGEAWLSALWQVADRDDFNTKLSGFAAAILLERGQMDTERLKLEVLRRLSFGTPAELGAGWFEGLAMKNRYALIARLSLWESLDNYLEGLDDEAFKRALVFLRRAFADFSAKEKDEIAENLGEIWNLNGSQVSEAVNGALGEKEMELVESLDDFDFDL